MKKAISIATAAVFLLSQSLGANAVETGLWQDRRAAKPARAFPGAAALPPPGNAAETLKNLSRARTAGPLPPELAPLLPILERESLRSIALPPAPSGRTVIFLQDVHREAAAQEGVSRLVGALAAAPNVKLIALEGTSGPLKIRSLRRFPRPEAVRMAADYLLKEDRISGAAHAALVAPGPIPPVLGVDDPALYRSNLAAWRLSERQRASAGSRIDALIAAADAEKGRVYNPALRDLDRRAAAYHAGKASLADFLAALPEDSSRRNVSVFLQAVDMERSLDFRRVAEERFRLLDALAPRLDGASMEALLLRTADYRSGRLRHEEFYGALSGLCARKGVPLKDYPLMDRYVRYVLLAGAVDGEALFREARAAEEGAYRALAGTAAERALAERSRRLALARKIVDFNLTQAEWGELRGGRAACAGDGAPDLSSFEDFYAAADARSAAMAGRLLALLPEAPSVAVLVSGGFHAGDVQRRLTEAGISVVSVAPSLGALPASGPAAALSLFAREKTPLEKLFSGRSLTLSPRPMPRETLEEAKVFTLLADEALNPALPREPEGEEELGLESRVQTRDAPGGVRAEVSNPRRARRVSLEAEVDLPRKRFGKIRERFARHRSLGSRISAFFSSARLLRILHGLDFIELSPLGRAIKEAGYSRDEITRLLANPWVQVRGRRVRLFLLLSRLEQANLIRWLKALFPPFHEGDPLRGPPLLFRDFKALQASYKAEKIDASRTILAPERIAPARVELLDFASVNGLPPRGLPEGITLHVPAPPKTASRAVREGRVAKVIQLGKGGELGLALRREDRWARVQGGRLSQYIHVPAFRRDAVLRELEGANWFDVDPNGIGVYQANPVPLLNPTAADLRAAGFKAREVREAIKKGGPAGDYFRRDSGEAVTRSMGSLGVLMDLVSSRALSEMIEQGVEAVFLGSGDPGAVLSLGRLDAFLASGKALQAAVTKPDDVYLVKPAGEPGAVAGKVVVREGRVIMKNLPPGSIVHLEKGRPVALTAAEGTRTPLEARRLADHGPYLAAIRQPHGLEWKTRLVQRQAFPPGVDRSNHLIGTGQYLIRVSAILELLKLTPQEYKDISQEALCGKIAKACAQFPIHARVTQVWAPRSDSGAGTARPAVRLTRDLSDLTAVMDTQYALIDRENRNIHGGHFAVLGAFNRESARPQIERMVDEIAQAEQHKPAEERNPAVMLARDKFTYVGPGGQQQTVPTVVLSLDPRRVKTVLSAQYTLSGRVTALDRKRLRVGFHNPSTERTAWYEGPDVARAFDGLWTWEEHLGEMRAGAPKNEVTAAVGNSNLLMNHRGVAWWNGRLIRPAGEDPYGKDRIYNSLVVYDDGRVAVEELHYAPARDGSTRVQSLKQEGADITEGLSWTAYGQRLVVDEEPVPTSDQPEEWSDLRLAFNFPRHEDDGVEEHFGLDQLLGDDGLPNEAARKAMEGFPVSLELSVRGAPINRERLEDMLADAGYKPAPQGSTPPGTYRVSGGKVAVGLLPARRPFSAAGVRRDGSFFVGQVQGREGRTGATLDELRRWMIQQGAVDALLLDSGRGVKMSYRGQAAASPEDRHSSVIGFIETQPPVEAQAPVEGVLVAVSGAGGSGKSRLISGIMRQLPSNTRFSVSWTTRRPRPKEEHGRHYHYTDRKSFEEALERDRLLEDAGERDGLFFAETIGFGEHLYGTPLAPIKEALNAGKIVLADVNTEGMEALRKIWPGLISYYLKAPSYKELARRLGKRGYEDAAEVRRRLDLAPIEDARAGEHDHTLISDDENPLEEIVISEAERRKDDLRLLLHARLEDLREAARQAGGAWPSAVRELQEAALASLPNEREALFKDFERSVLEAEGKEYSPKARQKLQALRAPLFDEYWTRTDEAGRAVGPVSRDAAHSAPHPVHDLAFAILLRPSDGKIILQKRGYHVRHNAGDLEFPGGHRNFPESPLQTIRRELDEETPLGNLPRSRFIPVRLPAELGPDFFKIRTPLENANVYVYIVPLTPEEEKRFALKNVELKDFWPEIFAPLGGDKIVARDRKLPKVKQAIREKLLKKKGSPENRGLERFETMALPALHWEELLDEHDGGSENIAGGIAALIGGRAVNKARHADAYRAIIAEAIAQALGALRPPSGEGPGGAGGENGGGAGPGASDPQASPRGDAQGAQALRALLSDEAPESLNLGAAELRERLAAVAAAGRLLEEGADPEAAALIKESGLGKLSALERFHRLVFSGVAPDGPAAGLLKRAAAEDPARPPLRIVAAPPGADRTSLSARIAAALALPEGADGAPSGLVRILAGDEESERTALRLLARRPDLRDKARLVRHPEAFAAGAFLLGRARAALAGELKDFGASHRWELLAPASMPVDYTGVEEGTPLWEALVYAFKSLEEAYLLRKGELRVIDRTARAVAAAA